MPHILYEVSTSSTMTELEENEIRVIAEIHDKPVEVSTVRGPPARTMRLWSDGDASQLGSVVGRLTTSIGIGEQR